MEAVIKRMEKVRSQRDCVAVEGIEQRLESRIDLDIGIEINEFIELVPVKKKVQSVRLDRGTQLENRVLEMEPTRSWYCQILGEDQVEGLFTWIEISLDPIHQNDDPQKVRIP